MDRIQRWTIEANFQELVTQATAAAAALNALDAARTNASGSRDREVFSADDSKNLKAYSDAFEKLNKARKEYAQAETKVSRQKKEFDNQTTQSQISMISRLASAYDQLAEARNKEYAARKTLRNLKDGGAEDTANAHARAAKEATKQQRAQEKAFKEGVKAAREKEKADREAAAAALAGSVAQGQLGKGYNSSATNARNATNATNAHTSSLNRNTSAAHSSTQANNANATSLGRSAAQARSATSANNSHAASSNRAGKSSARAARDHDINTRAMRRTAVTSRNLGSQLGALGRLFEDTGHKSRWWALVMKMLPLTAVASGINLLIPAITQLGGAIVGVVATLGPLVNLLGALPAMAVGAAGGIMGAVAGLGGIFKAMKAHQKMQDAISKEDSKSAANSQKTARSQAKSRRAAEKGVERAQKAQVKAARQITEAEQRVGEVAEANAKNIASAQKEIVQAQREVVTSQKAVTDARKAAARQLEDYKRALKNAALDEEGAVLSLEDARARLAEVMNDPGSSLLEQRQADLALREAEARLEEVGTTATRTREEANEALKKGVEGSDEVVDAKAREVEANERLKEAQANLQDTYKDNAKAMADAVQGVADAKEAYAEAGESVQDAKDNLADVVAGFEDAGSAASAAATATSEYDKALAALSPTAQEVVKLLTKMQEEWQEVQKRAQEAISPGLLSFLQDMQRTLLPKIADYLVEMAAGTGDWLAKLGKVLTTKKSMSQLTMIMEDGKYFMEAMGEAALNLIKWLLNIGEAAHRSGLVKWMSDVIRTWTEGWAAAADTPEGMQKSIDKMKDGMEMAKLWGSVLKNVWNMLKDLGRAMRPLGEGALRSLSSMTERWSDWIKSDAGQDKLDTFRQLAEVNLTGLGNTMKNIGRQFSKMMGSFDGGTTKNFEKFWRALNGDFDQNNGLLNALGDMVSMVDAGFISKIMGLGESIINILTEIGASGGVKMVENLVDIFASLAKTVESLLKNVPGLANVLVPLFTAMAAKPILMAVANLTGLTGGLKALANVKAKGITGLKTIPAFLAESLGFGNFYGNAAARGAKGIPIMGPQGPVLGGLPYPYPISGAGISAGKAGPASLLNYGAGATSSASALPMYAMGLQSAQGVQAMKQFQKTSSSVSATSKKDFLGIRAAASSAMTATSAKVTAAKVALSNFASTHPKLAKLGGVLKGIGAGLLGFAAMAGIGAGIGAMSRAADNGVVSFEKVAKSLKNFTSAGGDMSDVFNMKTGPVSNVKEAMEYLGRNDIVKSARSGVQGFADAIAGLFGQDFTTFDEGLAQRFEEIDNALYDLASNGNPEAAAESFRKLKEQAEETGTPIEELVSRMPQYRDRIKEIAKEQGIQIRNDRELADLMAGKEGPMRTAIEQLEQEKIALEEADRARKEYNEKVGDTIQKMRDAISKIKELNDAQTHAFELKEDVGAAWDSFMETLADASDVAKEVGTHTADFLMNAQTPEARAFRSYWKDVKREARGVADAMIANGDGVDEINAKMQEINTQTIEALTTQFGIGAGEAKKMAEEAGLIPRYINVDVVVSGPKLTPEEADWLNNKLGSLTALDPKIKREIIITATENGVEAVKEAVEDLLNILPGGGAGQINRWMDKDGNQVTQYGANPNNRSIRKKADGGYIRGPGSTTSDSIPALLSDKEYVVRASSVDGVGVGTMDYINKYGRLPRGRMFRNGGQVNKFKKGRQAFAGGGLASAAQISFSLNLQAVLGPIASVVNQATALVNMLNQLRKTMDAWGRDTTSLWSATWTRMSKISSSIMSSMLTTATTGMRGIASSFGIVGSSVSSVWIPLWNTVLRTASTSMSGVLQVVKTYSTQVNSTLAAMLSGTRTPIGQLIGLVNNSMGTLFNKVAGFFGIKDTPFPVNVPGFDTGGWTGPGSRLQPAGIVHADEFVVKKSSRKKIERSNPGVLDYMNKYGKVPGYAVGGLVGSGTGGFGGGEAVANPRQIVSYKGKRFTRRFLQAILMAQTLAGSQFHISQGGFRPRTSYSGTSHQADALDFTPVTARNVAASRAAGIAAWDRTGKGDWNPHIHGVPMPGYGYPGGSAVNQVRSFLRGGDGLGGRDNGPRILPGGVTAAQLEAFSGADNSMFSPEMFAALEAFPRAVNSAAATFKTAVSAQSGWGQIVGAAGEALARGALAKVASMGGHDTGLIPAYDRGGWTGPGRRFAPAGIVHADEFVIKKPSRRKIEKEHPGLLDYLNQTGAMPGYAAGGKVAPFKVYQSYMDKAALWGKTNKTPLADTLKHVKLVEELLIREKMGLWRKDANGIWNAADVVAWKNWQKKNKWSESGIVTAAQLAPLLKKYGVPFDTSTPYVAGYAQPTRIQALLGSQASSNARMNQFLGYTNKIKSWGLARLVEYLRDLGPTGIPDEYKDTANPMNGMEVAKAFAGNSADARKYNAMLLAADKMNEKENSNEVEAKLDAMIDLLKTGAHTPYGLNSVAAELGLSLDTTAALFKRAQSSGKLKGVSSTRLARILKDISQFDGLFRFSKGGIVPGTGNRDSVHALLTPGELVVPKDIVQSMFAPAPSITPFLDLRTSRVRPSDTTSAGSSKTINVNTNVYNPVREEASVSIQKRIRSSSRGGLFK